MKPINQMSRFLNAHIDEVKTAAYSLAIFLNIDTDVVSILMILMAVDTIFGVIKAAILGDEIDFKILLFGLCTKIMILIIPMVLALVGKGLKYDFTPLVTSVMKILVLAEGFSILTSAYSIKSRKRVKNVDMISALLAALRSMFLKSIRGLLKDVK